LWLAQNGVPFDLAFSMEPNMRSGFAIIISEQKSGRKFNWHSLKFDEK